MSAESRWASAIGIAVATLAWVVGLGNLLWPGHPLWALFFLAVVVTLVSTMILRRSERRSDTPIDHRTTHRAHN
jgi:membrane protein implicated in regulation of membrane protease activity